MRKVTWFLLLCALIGTSATASTIQGRIANAKGKGKAGIKVVIRGDLGFKFEDTSQADGSFRVGNVPEGWYFIRLENLENYVVTQPECGWFYDFVGNEDNGNYNFTVESTGVSVDFGRPGGGLGGGGYLPKRMGSLQENNGNFSLSVYANGLSSFGFSYPTRLEIEGAWYSQGQGPLEIDVVNGIPAGVYIGSGLNATYGTGPGNTIYLSMELNEFPYLSSNGEMATFEFQTTLLSRTILGINGDNACFCIASVRIWSGQSLLYNSSEQWCDQLEIN